MKFINYPIYHCETYSITIVDVEDGFQAYMDL